MPFEVRVKDKKEQREEPLALSTTDIVFQGKAFHWFSLETAHVPEEMSSASWDCGQLGNTPSWLSSPFSLPRGNPPSPLLPWGCIPPTTLLSESVSGGICLWLCSLGYLERQLPKIISLPSSGTGNKFRGKIGLKDYCPDRYARDM